MPFVQTLRCSCEKIKGQVDKWRYRCEVPLNKDTERERGREREATAAVELLLVHITHTKSICTEVTPLSLATDSGFGVNYSITVSSAWELTSVSMHYSQGNGVHTPLSRLAMYPRPV